MNVLCSRLIQTLEYAVQVRRLDAPQSHGAARANLGAFRTGEKARIQQGTQVKIQCLRQRLADARRAPISLQYRARLTCIFACRDRLCGVKNKSRR